MKTLILLMMALAMSGCSSVDSKPQIVFRGKTFVLKHQASTPTETVNEYIQAKESLEHWSEMLSVRVFPTLTDPSEAVSTVAASLKAQRPEANFAIWENADGSKVGLDFITWDSGETVAEFNVFIYQINPTGSGLLAHQYAKRGYSDKKSEYNKLAVFMLEIKHTRKSLITEVSQYQFPKLVNKETP